MIVGVKHMKSWNTFFRKNKNRANAVIVAATLLVAATFLSISIGVADLSLTQIIKAIREGANSGFEGNIFWYVRLPRTVACILSGAGLAVSGVIIQSVLANRLASPGIIGVNAGAGFAVVLCCALGTIYGFAVGGWTVTISAFFGAFFAMILVVMMAEKTGASRRTVILSGIAANSFLNAGSETLITLIPELTIINSDFRTGGFTTVTLQRLFPAGILIVIALVITFTLHNELDILNLGEETAQGLGLSAREMRTFFLVLSAILAGASVSFSGLLGFVGLIIPHIARRIIGDENRYLLVFCAFFGAAFVTFSDLAARMAFQPYELPVGILMSFIGGPFFIFLLLNRKAGNSYD